VFSASQRSQGPGFAGGGDLLAIVKGYERVFKPARVGFGFRLLPIRIAPCSLRQPRRARCFASLRPLRGDLRCARRTAERQVGTKGWPLAVEPRNGQAAVETALRSGS
jgi:hypothetical protein